MILKANIPNYFQSSLCAVRLGLCLNCPSNCGVVSFQDAGERQGSQLLAGLPRCRLPGGHPREQGVSSPLCLLCAHRGALYISVPDLHPRRHPGQRGASKLRVCGPCLIPSQRGTTDLPGTSSPKL